MPNLAMTLNQAFRYFLAGAFYMVLARWLGQPLERSLKFTEESRPGDWQVFLVLSLVIGSLTYCLHRAVVYPIFRRIIICVLIHRARSAKAWIPWWPLDVESELTGQRIKGVKTLEYFYGWSGEVHFLYMAAELSFFALWWWPGSQVPLCSWYMVAGVAAVVF